MKSQDSKLTVRSETVKLLRKVGLTTVFGNPGSTEINFLKDWPSDFRYVLGLQESTCVAMADGYAQAKRTVGFVNLHSASGLGHAMGSIYTAFLNQTPLIVTAGQQFRSMLTTNPYLFANEATILPKPYVKWSVEPARSEDVPIAISRAYHMAQLHPKGPVFVSIPADDWDKPTDPVIYRTVNSNVAPDPELIEEVADSLNSNNNIGLIVGAEVDQDNAWNDVVVLAEKLESEVYASPMSGRSSFPENHRLFAGFLPPVKKTILSLIKNYDVVLILGAPVFTYHLYSETEFSADSPIMWQFTSDPDSAARASMGDSVVCSMKLGIEILKNRVTQRTQRPQRVTAYSRRRGARPTNNRLNAENVYYELSIALPKNAIIVEEAPSHRGALRNNLPILQSGSFFCGSSGGLGWAMPAAVGVALAQPDRKVVCVIGDGSSLYSIQSIWTAVDLQLPISFIILNNKGYAAVEKIGALMNVQIETGVNIEGIDFVKVATGFGCQARQVNSFGDLRQSIQWSLNSSEPTLLDCLLELKDGEDIY